MSPFDAAITYSDLPGVPEHTAPHSLTAIVVAYLARINRKRVKAEEKTL